MGRDAGGQCRACQGTSTSYCVATGTHGKYPTDTGTATSAFYNGTSWTQHAAP
jgi:hypothetical protein